MRYGWRIPACAGMTGEGCPRTLRLAGVRATMMMAAGCPRPLRLAVGAPGPGLAAAQAGVQGVAEGVAEEVDGEYHHGDGDAGEYGQPPRCADVARPLG